MVLQKRLDYGFNGYQVPPVPRAARSARRRRKIWKKVDDSPMCAFELLATVAGKLLLEEESFSGFENALIGKKHCTLAERSLKKEELDEVNLMTVENCEQGNGERNLVVSDPVSQTFPLNYTSKEFQIAQSDACSGQASVITTAGCLEKEVSAEKLVNCKSEVGFGIVSNKVKLGFSGNCKAVKDDNTTKQIKIEPSKAERVVSSAGANTCSSENQVFWDRKSTALVSIDNSVKLSMYRNGIPNCSRPVSQDDVKLVTRDDDENSSGCSQPSTSAKAFRPPSRIGDRRIRKLLASKYWQMTPKRKNDEHFNTERKPIHYIRKNCYKRQRSQKDYPIKKRRLHARNSVSNSDGGISSEVISSSPALGSSLEAFTSASGMAAPFAGQHTSLLHRDSHVKLRIKSFKVPELLIEIPETETIGSLKRTVMEAVTAILGSGLHVGVLYQGKKIRDDSKTLQQSGISHDNQLGALGFTLEPNPPQTSPRISPEDCPVLLPCDARHSLTRFPLVPDQIQPGSPEVSLYPPATNLANFVESDHDSAPSPPDISVDKSTTDSRALVAFPAMSVEALAMVPSRKSKRCEVVQRRIRRPFSVSEVEALVQAVEKLGTGRWRDVKLRAFDNSKHRTYVDLKDKWKTLVHTARIAPQQRRGAPVPQELLDRVLAAHAYWSQQQAKQQLKQHSDTRYLV